MVLCTTVRTDCNMIRLPPQSPLRILSKIVITVTIIRIATAAYLPRPTILSTPERSLSSRPSSQWPFYRLGTTFRITHLS